MNQRVGPSSAVGAPWRHPFLVYADFDRFTLDNPFSLELPEYG
jgi:hypothetical protein